MLKKITLIIFVLIIVTVPAALANDGGSYTAGSEKLEIKVKVKSKTAQIGENFTIQVSMQNNDKYPIMIDDISSIFDGCYVGIGAKDIPAFDEYILPGSVAYFDITFKVPQTIKWYKEDEKFYADIKLKLYYFAVCYEPPADYEFTRDSWWDDYYWDYFNEPLEPTQIEITNLYSGDNLVSLKVNEEVGNYNFYRYTYVSRNNQDKGELYAELSNTITVSNISGKDIDYIYIPHSSIYHSSSHAGDDEYFLEKNDSIVQEVENYYFIVPEDIPETLPAIYEATFIIDGKYYGVIEYMNWPTNIVATPQIEAAFSDVELDGTIGKCTLTIKNTSSIAYNSFVCYFDKRSELILHDSDRVYTNSSKPFAPGDTIEIDYQFDTENWYNYSFQAGYLLDDIVYKWSIGYDYANGVISNIYYNNIRYGSSINSYSDFVDIAPAATKSPHIISTIYDTPTSAISPAPLLEATPSLSPTSPPSIEVVKTNQRPSVPIWVYITLGVVIIVVGWMIFSSRKNSTSKDN